MKKTVSIGTPSASNFAMNGNGLRAAAVGLILFFAFGSQAEQQGSQAPAQAQNNKKAKGKTNRQAEQSLTGCVDERDGKYVLLDAQILNKMADLQAMAGSAEAVFAKHLGHKVLVRGEKSTDSETTIFKVRSIQDLSGECAPAQGTQ